MGEGGGSGSKLSTKGSKNGASTSSSSLNESSRNLQEALKPQPQPAEVDKADETRVSKDFSDVKLSILVSLSAFPLLYLVNYMFEQLNPEFTILAMAITGVIMLLTVPMAITKFIKLKTWAGYTFILFTFTSMIDLIITLEYHGYIKGFMTVYLAKGEPYLQSPWGNAICAHDGTGFYLLYLFLVYQISNGKSWRSTGIYWASALVNSMTVLLFGVACGRHNLTFCTFLNGPWAVVPFVFGIPLFTKEKRPSWNEDGSAPGSKSSFGKVLDSVTALGYLLSIWIIFTKATIVMNTQFAVFLQYWDHERILTYDDPAPFVRIQSLMFLFFILPMQVVSLVYTLQKKKPKFLWEITLAQAGVMFHAQFSVIVTALDPKLEKDVITDLTDVQFWIYNLILLIIPHLQLWLLYKRHVVQEVEGKMVKAVKERVPDTDSKKKM